LAITVDKMMLDFRGRSGISDKMSPFLDPILTGVTHVGGKIAAACKRQILISKELHT